MINNSSISKQCLHRYFTYTCVSSPISMNLTFTTQEVRQVLELGDYKATRTPMRSVVTPLVFAPWISEYAFT